MNFDRFSRSMLLAQGGFDVFLQASASNRAPILEQIAGTEIYSAISKWVHERNRAEVEKLSVLQVELSGLVLLDAKEEAVIKTAKFCEWVGKMLFFWQIDFFVTLRS